MTAEPGHHPGRAFTGQDGRHNQNRSVPLAPVQTIDMADATFKLGLDAAQSSHVLFVDPNSGGASEELWLPPVEDGLHVLIVNTGGEAIALKDAAGADVANGPVEIATAEIAWAASNGAIWHAGVGKAT